MNADQPEFLDKVDDERLRELYRYWDDLRGDRFAPAYAAVDPIAIPKLLPYLLITQVESGPDGRRYRYRLCGTEVERCFGQAMKGHCIDELMRGDYRTYMLGLYDRVVDGRSPVYSVSAYDGRVLRTKRLMLPLSGDGATVDLVLSAQVFFRSQANPQPVIAVQDAFEPHFARADTASDA